MQPSTAFTSGLIWIWRGRANVEWALLASSWRAALRAGIFLALLASRAVADQNAVAVEGEKVELPPFVVTKVMEGPGWRYASIPGFEILSEASDRETREVVAALWRGRQLVLPPEMQPQFSVPMTVVVFRQPPGANAAPGGLGLVQGQGEIRSHWTNVIKRTISDRESFAVNLWDRRFEYSPAFRYDIRTLLWRRTPAVPEWLSVGLFSPAGVHREGVYWDEDTSQKRVHLAVWGSRLEVKLVRRLRREATEQLAKTPPINAVSPMEGYLCDLRDVLEQPVPDPADANYARWVYTQGLFVRWGAFAESAERRAGFWRLANRACAEPVSERLFMECLGLTYAQAQRELGWYLVVALQTEASAPVEMRPMPRVVFKDASHAEFARVFGEWQRIEARALAADFPEFAKTYRERAGETLTRTKMFKDARRDPRTAASLGLLALETQEFARAHELLEEAVRAKVAGPVVYLEAARLRWAERVGGETETLSASDRAGISELLLIAESQTPAMAAVYVTLAKLVRTTNALTPAETAALRRGLTHFPQDLTTRAILRSALSSQELEE